MTFSRREFFKLLGIAAASSKLTSIIPPYAAPVLAENTPLLARKLSASPLMPIPAHYRLSDADGMLPTDSVMPVLGIEDGFLRVPQGYIHASRVQSILRADYQPPASLTTQTFPLPTWVNVAAPSAGLYKLADAASFQEKRVGHGGILQAVDFLPAASPNAPSWIALTDETGAHIGWSQAHLWRALDLSDTSQTDSRHVIIDSAAYHLYAYHDDQEIFSAPLVPAEWMPRGSYTVTAKVPGITAGGAPYALTLDSFDVRQQRFRITGAYWHNLFGQPHTVSGTDMHLTVHAARALYAFAPIGMRVTVI